MSDGNLAVPEHALRAGALVEGRFCIEADLGEGPVGRIFKARDVRYEETVALHVVRSGPSGDEDSVERLKREVRRAQAVVHPAMARIGEISDDGPLTLVATEHVEGTTLRDELSRRGAFPVPLAVRVGTELFEALAAAHAQRVVHRDIHPRNVVMLPSGRIKVLALGMAPALQTRAADGKGSSEYRSPEQLIGAETDARTDLYSGGVLLFELLTGALPFRGRDRPEASSAPAVMEASPPSSLAPLVPPLLDMLVLRLLSRDRDRRPTSARAVATELHSMRR